MFLNFTIRTTELKYLNAREFMMSGRIDYIKKSNRIMGYGKNLPTVTKIF